MHASEDLEQVKGSEQKILLGNILTIIFIYTIFSYSLSN